MWLIKSGQKQIFTVVDSDFYTKLLLMFLSGFDLMIHI